MILRLDELEILGQQQVILNSLAEPMAMEQKRANWASRFLSLKLIAVR
jgi:hypothetical protein